MLKNNLQIITAKQNQKFPFHFFFRFAAEGWGEEAREKCKEIFWFLHTRVRERVRGALVSFTTQSERTMQFQATTRSARAIQSSSGFWSKYIRTLSNTHRQSTYKQSQWTNPLAFSVLIFSEVFPNELLPRCAHGDAHRPHSHASAPRLYTLPPDLLWQTG